MTTLIISNEEMINIMEIVKYLEKLGLLRKKNQQSKWKCSKRAKTCIYWHVLSIIITTLSEQILVGKGVTQAGEVTDKTKQDFKCRLIL